MHSADHVLPEYQHPEIGEGFGFGANEMSMEPASLVMERKMLLGIKQRAEQPVRREREDARA